jgi:hypothetical protein
MAQKIKHSLVVPKLICPIPDQHHALYSRLDSGACLLHEFFVAS